MDGIEKQLESARKELLDLGLRNPLINFRTMRARGVEIVDENPVDLFDILVTNSQSMQFAPTETENAQAALTEEGQPHNPHQEDKFKDKILQTPYGSAELQKRLLHSYYTTQTYIQEQGINVLYLALGMLHWRDPKTINKERRAPLLLIPVTLSRLGANENFTLSYTGTDFGDNLALKMKLINEFDLFIPDLPEADLVQCDNYFGQVKDVVAGMSDWFVDKTAVSLGFFSFSKFLIYNDLDHNQWPQAKNPLNHPILHNLLDAVGFNETVSTHDAEHIDSHLPLTESYQVADADSSQAIAINDVNQGKNLVIQGPPGTGKSQTITNLIAEAVGNGKTVLFVAEKMAALDVVKRRLDELHIGDIALELHSYKTTKRNVLQELARTVKLGQPKFDGEFAQLGELVSVQNYLNSYHQAINQQIGSSGLSLAKAYGEALQLKKQLAPYNPPTIKPTAMREWSQDEYKAHEGLTAVLQQLIAEMGPPSQHPFANSTCTELPTNATQIIKTQSQHTLNILQALRTQINALATHLNITPPQTMPQLDSLLINAQLLLRVPNLYEVDIQSELWATDGDGIVEALQAGLTITNHKLSYDQWLIPEAWTQDVIQIRQGLMAGPKFWRVLSGRHRSAKQALTGLCRRELPGEWEAQLGAVDAILEVQRMQPTFQKYESQFPKLFGIRWQGDESNWEELIQISEWLASTAKDLQNGNYPPELLAYATQGIQRVWLGEIIPEIHELQADYRKATQQLLTFLQSTESEHDFERRAFAAQETIIRNVHGGAERFAEIVRFNQLATQFKEANLQQFLPIADSWPHASTQLVLLFKQSWLVTLIEKGEVANAIFNEFTSDAFHNASASYQQLDKQFLIANRHKIATEHWRQLPRYKGWGQMGLLQAEMGKKRSHMPIRQLMQRAGQAVQLIKPLFMMSPLSIAAYLPPDSVEFDLVVFDEASQVRPFEAFGAILRGKQVVVVGDSKQLPPTMFFENILGKEASTDSLDEDDEQEADIFEAKNESILDLFTAQNAPKRMLRWHYRSQHESLIAISNRAFYDQRLIIFPSPDRSRQKSGLRLRYHPETVYARGGNRTNVGEAKLVAQAVLQHAQQHPELSLGVVTFSTSQRNAIRRQLEQLRRQDPSFEPFFHAHEHEPFFIKNLENVQGDERDVILISVGYGRSADGTMTMNFGPLNQKGGERRLNVLITRSRQRCELFCNFTADEINLNRTKSVGVEVLKDYLQYAATGELPLADYATGAQPTPFEQFITDELTADGLHVTPKVGAGQMRIDMGITDQKDDPFYRAGINSDHARNYLTFSCRDRERIQKEVLSRLGWNTINLLSHAWWHNFAAERRQLIAQLEGASQPEQPNSTINTIPPFARYTELEDFDLPRPIPEYETAVLAVDESYKNLFKQYGNNNSDTQRLLSNANQSNRELRHTLNQLRKAEPTYQKYNKNSWQFINQYIFDHGLEDLLIQLSVMNKYYRKLQKQHEKTIQTRTDILQLITSVIEKESPVHISEVLRRISLAAGFKTHNNRILYADHLIRHDLRRTETAHALGGDFWMTPDQQKIWVRERKSMPKGSKKFEFISDAEIDEAVIIIVHDAVAITQDDLYLRVGQLLGFRQIGQAAQLRIEASVQRSLLLGFLNKTGSQLTINRNNLDLSYLLEPPYHSNL